MTEETQITSDESFIEMLMMGLRLREGVPLARLEAVAQCSVEAMFDPRILSDLTGVGYLEITGEVIRATDAGRQRLNAILAALLEASP